MLDTQDVGKREAPKRGEVLLRDFLEPAGMSHAALARAVGLAPYRIAKIVRGERGVTAETDLRLTRYWGLRPGFFLDLQTKHDLLKRSLKISPHLALISPRATQ